MSEEDKTQNAKSKEGKSAAHKKPGTEAVQAEITSLNNQVQQLTDALRRERADAENLRRRHDDQVANLKTMVKADVVRELLPVIDNVERALSHVPDELQDSDFIKGVQGIAKQFAGTLERLGVEKIKTTGEPFDPNLHEAVSAEQGDGNQEIVSEGLQSGYKVDGEVIRHAMVRVTTK